MLRRFSINFTIFSMFLDGAILLGNMVLTTFLRPSMSSLPGIAKISSTINLPSILFIIFPALWVGVLAAFSIYDGRKNLRIVDELATLTAGTFIASISMAGILYLSFREVSRALFLTVVFLTYFICILWRLIARSAFRLRKKYSVSPQKVLVIGKGTIGSRMADQFFSELNGNRDKSYSGLQSHIYDYVGYLDLGKLVVSKSERPIKGFSELGELPAWVMENGATELIIALPHTDQELLDTLVLLMEKVPIKLWVALDFFDLALHNAAIAEFAGVPMVDLRAPAISDYDRIIKRLFDIIFAFFITLFLLPLMGFIAVLILIFDGWPVLYSQMRVGENGKPFRMHKFRTMLVNADQMVNTVEKIDSLGHKIHKSRNDPRVTKLGRFLRRFSLDELPQLFNVLSGDMSLVGPRPELPILVDEYKHWQRQRMAVPPGITGWWQVNGRSERTMHLHVEDDLYYVNHYSIWLDLWILLKTGWVVLTGRGAY